MHKEGQKKTGKGRAYLINQSGNTKDGSTIWLLIKDDVLIQIGLEYEDMEASIPMTVYVDGVKKNTIQVGEKGQSTIDLKDKDLLVGTHNVEMIQEKDNKVVYYSIEKYEVKNK